MESDISRDAEAKLIRFLNLSQLDATMIEEAFELEGRTIGRDVVRELLTERRERRFETLSDVDSVRLVDRSLVELMLAAAADGKLDPFLEDVRAVLEPWLLAERYAQEPPAYDLQPPGPTAVVALLTQAIEAVELMGGLGLAEKAAVDELVSELRRGLQATDLAAALDTDDLAPAALAERTREVLASVTAALLEVAPDKGARFPVDADRDPFEFLPFSDVPEIVTGPPAFFTSSAPLSPQEYEEAFDLLDRALRELWRRLTPGQRAAIQKRFLDVYSVLNRLRAIGYRPSLMRALGQSIQNLIRALIRAGISDRLLGQFVRGLLARVGILFGGGAGTAGAGFSLKFGLLILWGYLWHRIAKWAFEQKIPGTDQTYRDFYADLLFRLLFKTDCDELLAEVNRRTDFVNRLRKARSGLTNATELAENAEALVTEITSLLLVIDRALQICGRETGARRPLEIRRKQLVQQLIDLTK